MLNIEVLAAGSATECGRHGRVCGEQRRSGTLSRRLPLTDPARDDYDTPWKEALERYLPDFLALLFPQAHAGIDWSQGYEFLDKELQQVVRDAELGRRLADKLVRVVDTDGQEDWLLIHIEVQADPDADLAERLFVYNYRIYDRHRRPVVSLAVLADERADWRPDRFGWQRWGCEVGIRFPSVKLLDYRPRWAELETSTNPFAVVVQAHLKTQETRRAPQKRYRAKLALSKSLYRRGWGRDDILELFRFIDWMLRLPEELEERLWSEIQTYETVEHMPYVTSVERIGIRKGIERGIEQGIEQGIQQGLQHERLLLLRLVDKRFGAAVAEQSAPLLDRIDNAQLLEDLAEALLDTTDGTAWLRTLTQAAG